jgi:cathepsin B
MLRAKSYNTKLASSKEFKNEFKSLRKSPVNIEKYDKSIPTPSDQPFLPKYNSNVKTMTTSKPISLKDMENERAVYKIRTDEKNKRTEQLKGKKITAADIKKYRQFNTILASSGIFKAEFKSLKIDRTVGKSLSGTPLQIPNSFDGRIVWKDYVFPARDQGLCGGCWAFAVTSVLASRLSIYTNGKYKFKFSPAQMIMCNLGGEDEYIIAEKNIEYGQPYDYNLPSNRQEARVDEKAALNKFGCNGETLIGGWQYAYRFGVAEEECSKYRGPNVSLYNYNPADDIGTCADLLSDTYDVCPDTKLPLITHLCGGYYYVSGTTTTDESIFDSGSELDIRRDIYKWGPTSTAFKCYEDLLNWSTPDAVYQWDKKSKYIGGHAVSLIGWGETSDNIKYWIVKNSWGEGWNNDGCFKMIRGVNDCEIEENVFVGFPNLYGFRLYIEWPLLYRTEDFTLRLIWGVQNTGYKMTTYEKLITGKLKYDAKIYQNQPIDQELYVKEYWPDMSSLIAAQPHKIVYRLGQNLDVFMSFKEIIDYNQDLFSLILYFILLCILLLLIFSVITHYKKIDFSLKFNPRKSK